MNFVDSSACGWNVLADSHLQPLAKPDLLHAGQRYRENRDTGVDREVRKAPLKREESPFVGSKVAFREHRHDAACL